MATITPHPDALLNAFRERAGALGVEVQCVADSHEAAARILDIAVEAGTDDMATTAELMRRAPALVDACVAVGLAPRVPSSPDSLRDAALGLTFGHAAYAGTGSVLLAEPSLNDRAVGMLARTLIVVVASDTLVPGLDQAATDLRTAATRPGGGYATIMTGPSRTADIERVLTVGVQGPGRVVVVLVDALT